MSALPDLLPIQPFRRSAKGSVDLPGSKSLTNRALLLAALCEQPVILEGALSSEDTELMVESLRKMGLSIEIDEAGARMRVSDQTRAFSCDQATLFVGLAGTAARFLTALCAAAPRGCWTIDGVPQMRRRPMRGLIEALRQLGADIRCTGEEGFFPIEIHARGLNGGRVRIDASESSQMLSALLMVSPLARAPVEIEIVGGVRWPFVEMTARMMEHFGQAPLERRKDGLLRPAIGHRYALPASSAGRYRIEPDATAASYFEALPLVVGGSLILKGLRGPGEGLQGDIAFALVLQKAGLTLEMGIECLRCSFEPGRPKSAVTADFNAFSDTFLTLAAISPLLVGTTRIEGIAHTRKQETDRVAGMASELTKLGQVVHEQEDALTIEPRPLRPGVEIDTHGDHRFAMSFGVLGCHDLHGDGTPWLSLRNPSCCAKTFPHFFALLEELRRKSLEA